MTLLDHNHRPTEDPPDALIEEAREVTRRRRRGWAGAWLVLIVLAGVGFFVFSGGGGAAHGKPPVALHGPLPAGITARAPDPSGGLPWGTRLVSSDGYTCLQLGRLSGDQLGDVGMDNSYGNDGRFHPFGVNASQHAHCVRDDGAGHAFMTVAAGALPASAAVDGWNGNKVTADAGCDLASEVASAHRHAKLLQRDSSARSLKDFSRPACPTADERFVQYGLLGPKAQSVTYTYNGHMITDPTTGPDGAYLVVAPATSAFCDELPKDNFCGSDGYTNTISGGMIESVRYRNGKTCSVRSSNLLDDQCSTVGYVTPKPSTVTGVASPVTARLITAKHYCFGDGAHVSTSGPAPATDLGPYLPCNGPVPAHETRAYQNPKGTDIVFSWTARRASSGKTSAYGYRISRTGPDRQGCGDGEGGVIEGHVHAGERLTRGAFNPSNCPGSFTGTIFYYPTLGPEGIRSVVLFDRSGAAAGVVGNFHLAIK